LSNENRVSVAIHLAYAPLIKVIRMVLRAQRNKGFKG